MTEKETLIGTRAETATAMAGLGGVCFWNDQHRYAFPLSLIFNELRQLVRAPTISEMPFSTCFSLVNFRLLSGHWSGHGSL